MVQESPRSALCSLVDSTAVWKTYGVVIAFLGRGVILPSSLHSLHSLGIFGSRAVNDVVLSELRYPQGAYSLVFRTNQH